MGVGTSRYRGGEARAARCLRESLKDEVTLLPTYSFVVLCAVTLTHLLDLRMREMMRCERRREEEREEGKCQECESSVSSVREAELVNSSRGHHRCRPFHFQWTQSLLLFTALLSFHCYCCNVELGAYRSQGWRWI
jgi:hypothetical protein